MRREAVDLHRFIRRCVALILTAGITVSAAGCSRQERYSRYQGDFSDVFDTYTIILGYETSQAEFDRHLEQIHSDMQALHRLFDIYNDYEGINNLKTVNDNAGTAPVVVDEEIIRLLQFGMEAYAQTEGSVNIAMGSVLRLWHEYRETGIANPTNAETPPMELLQEAAAHTDMQDLVIDESALTVYLRDPEMSLDVGAIAKGYAVEYAAQRAEENGMVSAILNAGGNVRVIGAPMDGREFWGVGIQDPNSDPYGAQQLYDTVYVADTSVVTSGDYQRYYLVGDETWHHIIDPQTLMPAKHMKAFSVIYPDSAVADMLSTAVFILPVEQGRKLIERYDAEGLWILFDGEEATDGYQAMSQIAAASQSQK